MQFKISSAMVMAIMVATPALANPLARRSHFHERRVPAATAAVAAPPPAASADATLKAANIQLASNSDGNVVQEPGQSASQTSAENFVNICSGQTLTQGLQNVAGSCNGIPMGQIPSKQNMISTIITSPTADKPPAADTDFEVNLKVQNLAAGSFTNAQLTYYAAPQKLDGSGNVIGHTHITIQSLGKDLNPTAPPDPKAFVFFKGINDVGDGNGGLKATVTGGLPAGNYRICTMTSASNHQSVAMPVAQRGTPDDCTKLTISGANGAGGAAVSSASGASASSSSSSAAAAASPAAAAGGNKKGGKQAVAAAQSSTTITTSTTAASASASASPSASTSAAAAPSASPVDGNTYTNVADGQYQNKAGKRSMSGIDGLQA